MDGTPPSRAAKAIGIPVNCVCVGERGEYRSVDGRWDALCGLERGGALLVRPDQHVAWRSARAPLDPAAELERVMQVLSMKEQAAMENA
ncbi:hypothetical protein [Novosphingobium sp. 9U]|uniref:aromatic-ring hydroxylase C-terminal domain-containing protein n=1 Tax=Novosphingobium sp. 9U TaxID=2653158 RepID=UPI00135BF019|nr:hypothetical protein [Novosphingobium sp. 9U]